MAKVKIAKGFKVKDGDQLVVTLVGTIKVYGQEDAWAELQLSDGTEVLDVHALVDDDDETRLADGVTIIKLTGKGE